MSKRFDNRKLLYVLGALLAVLLITVLIKIPGERSTLARSLVEFDTSDVARIVYKPSLVNEEVFEFVRTNDSWIIKQGDIETKPMTGAVQNIFRDVLSIKPQSLTATGKSKWAEYNLTDSLATGLRFVNGRGKVLADLLIGRFSYRQPSNPYNYYGGNSVEGTSYVRLSGEDEVYAVDGFIAFSFNGGFYDWRDRSFIRCKKDDILSINVTMPGDSGYKLVKKEKLWTVNDMPADSAAVDSYLGALTYVDGDEFRDKYQPTSNPEYQMVIEGNNLLGITIKGYSGEGNDEVTLNSSLNPGIYFASDRSGLLKDIFRSAKSFLLK